MSYVSAQRVPITPNMPIRVAQVAKILNALKLPADPLIYDGELPGQGTSFDGSRAELLARTLSGLINGLEGKSVIDIACGEVNERTNETVTLETLRRIGTKLSLYVGVDPTIPVRLLGEQEAGGVRAIYLPVSLYELDDSAVRGIGNADVVMSSLFFGYPMGSCAAQMTRKISTAISRLSPSERLAFYSQNPAWEAMSFASMASLGTGGPIRSFVEFMAQEYCRRLISAVGWVAHFVLMKEPSLSVEMAEAAGLKLYSKNELVHGGSSHAFNEGTLSIFKPIS